MHSQTITAKSDYDRAVSLILLAPLQAHHRLKMGGGHVIFDGFPFLAMAKPPFCTTAS